MVVRMVQRVPNATRPGHSIAQGAEFLYVLRATPMFAALRQTCVWLLYQPVGIQPTYTTNRLHMTNLQVLGQTIDLLVCFLADLCRRCLRASD